MKTLEREKAIAMRLRGERSYNAIARELKVSKSTLSRWLEDMPLSQVRLIELRREGWNNGERKRERFRETMRLKREEKEAAVYLAQRKKLGNISEQALFTAGLLLYEAEGDKKSRSEISFTNTNPEMVRFFMFWAMRFLDIDKKAFRVQLHLYENMDIEAEEAFWRRALELPREQFWKIQVRPLRANSFTYKNASRHGTCKLYAGSVTKKTELRLSIRAFFDTYNKHMRA